MPEHRNPEESTNTTRPARITFLTISFLAISLYHFAQIILVIKNWSTISDFPLTISPAYLIADGLVWFSAGLTLCWGLWKGKKWARNAGMIISLLYSLAFWVDQIWISANPEFSLEWPADLAISLLGLGAIWLIINHPDSQGYFQ
jgi:hypothetical protein